MSLIGTTNDEKIWNFLKSKINNEYGVAGIMGNLHAESGLNPINLQNTYNKSLGLTDEQYTIAVDANTYTNFVNDKAGYGLAQWTYSGRKRNLLTFAKSKGASIGDLEMQLEFLMHELTGISNCLKGLMTATSILEASNHMLLEFEKPARQDEVVQQKRAEYSLIYFKKFAKGGSVISSTIETENATTPTYSNSSLICTSIISPNKTSPRNHVIDTITIHCMAGNLTVESCGALFAKSTREASSNYGIGTDGRIALYVDEQDRSWCSSNKANDNRAVTIEVANDSGAPDWHVSDAAMESLIKLCADICKRNHIKELKWLADKNLIGQVDKQNMTVHRWFAAKACPGDFLYEKHGYIAEEVNKLLGAGTVVQPTVEPKPVTPQPATSALYRVRKSWSDAQSQIGAFSILENAKKVCKVGYSVFDEEGNVIYSPFLVKVKASALNIRSGPGTNYGITGCIKDQGVYTIVETSGTWGKLLSGVGWISLNYCQKR